MATDSFWRVSVRVRELHGEMDFGRIFGVGTPLIDISAGRLDVMELDEVTR